MTKTVTKYNHHFGKRLGEIPPEPMILPDRSLWKQSHGFGTLKGIKLASLISSNITNTGFAPWPSYSDHKWTGSETLTHLYCGIEMFSQCLFENTTAGETGRALAKERRYVVDNMYFSNNVVTWAVREKSGLEQYSRKGKFSSTWQTGLKCWR